MTQQQMTGSVCGFMGVLHNIASEEKPISQTHDCSVCLGCQSVM